MRDGFQRLLIFPQAMQPVNQSIIKQGARRSDEN
jgi:hypothetical protein